MLQCKSKYIGALDLLKHYIVHYKKKIHFAYARLIIPHRLSYTSNNVYSI